MGKTTGSQPGGSIVVINHCPYCNKDFEMTKRSFANHMKYCDENPKVKENLRLYGKKTSKATGDKIRQKTEENEVRLKGEFKYFEVTCERCGNHFKVKEREFLFPEREHYFCSRSCANHNHNTKHSDEARKKMSDKVRQWYKEHRHYINENEFTPWEQEEKICPSCGKTFITMKKGQICCSVSCGAKYGSLQKELKKYEAIDNDIDKAKFKLNTFRRQCWFKFSLNSYPDEFDFDLIREYGWYKAKNHGNNMKGVSRDHRLSIIEAINQRIDPYYVSHPANCELILQTSNASKHSKSSISKEELYKRVEEWNKKYGEYPNTINYSFIEDMIDK